jgi:hypothetical protein
MRNTLAYYGTELSRKMFSDKGPWDQSYKKVWYGKAGRLYSYWITNGLAYKTKPSPKPVKYLIVQAPGPNVIKLSEA